MEQRYKKIVMMVFAFLTLISNPNVIFAENIQELNICPNQIVLTLPKSHDQKYTVSTTLNPMKIIIDSTRDNFEFPGVTRYNDVVFKEMRFSRTATGSRLVLEFKYQVPKPNVVEYENFVQIEIDKTYIHGSRRLVEKGIFYGHQRRGDIFGPNVVNYLEIDLNQGIEVKLGLAQNKVFGSEYVSTIGERFNAFAAVNGAFFAPNGRPLGVLMIDGELISEPYANRTALGMGEGSLVMGAVDFRGEVLDEDGTFISELHGLNRPREYGELVAFTSYYGNCTNTNEYGHEITVVDGKVTNTQPGNSLIPSTGFVLSAMGEAKDILETFQVGDQLQINLELIPEWSEKNITQIIGGGPRLVRDGKVELTGEKERFLNDILIGRNPRTALGITADNKLLLVTVNGRQPNISIGMTLKELAEFLIELGAVEAMNLDGGGSTTMVVRNLVLNIPSDGSERAVSNAIVVIASPK